MIRKSTRGRPPGQGVKQNRVLNYLRGQILQGTAAPGSRLPTRSTLERQFNVSWLTVQRAMDRLKRDGFVHPRGRHGTFVATNPPHLCVYGLVLESERSDQNRWSRFWTALCNEAAGLERSGPRKFNYYYNVSGHADSEDYRRLLDDVRAHRLGGVILGFSPNALVGTPLLENADLPRVALVRPPFLPGLPSIDFDFLSFMDKALDYFKSRGRKRVAVIDTAHDDFSHHQRFVTGVAARGMTTRPYWVQAAHHLHLPSAKGFVHLLMHEGQSERPDALIIADDNIVEPATAGLIAAGVRVPQDVEVVAHCNFPWPPPTVLPVKRLGFDAGGALELCIASISAQRRGEQVPLVTRLPAVFEDEISAKA